MENPNKWIYEPNDITILNAALDGLAGRLEIEGSDEARVVRGAISVIFEMSEQQRYLAMGIERLKQQIEDEKRIQE